MTTFLSDIVLAGANDIQFKNTSGANTGKIESDGNNLVLSNAVGDILLGDGASDVYIGDGTNNVDILFEQSGSIKAEDGSSGVTLTLGSGDTTLALGSSISSTLTVGVDDTGYDVKFFGATSGKYMLWDQSADQLVVSGTVDITSAASTAHMISLHNTTNGAGCSINFSDITDGSQTGTIDFLHQDGSSEGGGASFNISSTESDMVLVVGGRITATAHSSNAEVDYGFVGDINTGMMRSGADAIRFVTGGTAALDINSSQNATFAGTIGSGAITSTGKITGTELEGTSLDINGNGDISGKLVLPQTSTTIGTANLANASLLVGSTSAGIGIDNNEIVANGNTLNISTISGNDIKFRTGATDVLLLDSSQNTTFSGNVTVGVDDTGHDVKFFGATSGRYVEWDESSDCLRLADNTLVKFGYGNDLVIYHDGSNNHITADNGDLTFTVNENDHDIIFKSDDGSGGTTAYLTLDGSEARTNVHKNMLFDDSVTLGIGASYDLQLYHNGSTSLISNQTGNLYLRNQADDGDIIIQADDGSGGDATYMTFDGGIASILTYRDILMANDGNDGKIKFGASQDLSIYHDGSNSYIDQTGTGNLIIRNTTDDADIIFQSDDGSGGVTAYLTLDGSEGYTVANKNIRFQDNIEARFGSGNDMKLFHTGAYSMIQNLTGDLFIQNVADDKDIIFQSDDGSGGVETYFYLDGSQADGTYSFTIFPDNSLAAFGDSTDLQIYHDGTNTKLLNYTGDLQIINYADDKDIIFQSDDGSGGVATYFYLDGGGALTRFDKKLRASDDVKIEAGSSGDLQIYHDATNSIIDNLTGNFYIRNQANDKDIVFICDDGSGGTATYFYLDGSSATNIFSKDVLLSDNISLKIGNAADMKLYHDGSNSYINQQGTGDLYLRQNTDDGDIIFQSDDGSGGLATYLTLDGSAAETKVDKDMRFSDNVNLRIGTNSDVVIVHDNSNFTTTNYTGNYNIINQQVDGDIVFQTDDGSGGVETYLTIDGGSQEIIATKPIVTGESQIKVLPHHFMSNEDGGANKSAQFRDDTIIGVRTSADSAELYAFVEIPYGKTARTVTVYGNDTSLVVNVYESDINAGALTDKTPGAGCVVGTACDITDVAYSATNYLVIKVTTVSYTNDIVYGAVVTIG